jgi:hypothetical protein
LSEPGGEALAWIATHATLMMGMRSSSATSEHEKKRRARVILLF